MVNDNITFHLVVLDKTLFNVSNVVEKVKVFKNRHKQHLKVNPLIENEEVHYSTKEDEKLKKYVI